MGRLQTVAIRRSEVRCRFCPWRSPLWGRDAAGKSRSGWTLLREHVTMEHRESLDTLRSALAGAVAAGEAREEVSEMAIEVGSVVEFVDQEGRKLPGLVTAVWGQENQLGHKPSLNLVFVSLDPSRTDVYGRQVERETSIPHREQQAAPGFFWREPA